LTILVDSSVWIDFFRGNVTRQTDYLAPRIKLGQFVGGDLILAEVLQGCDSELEFDRVHRVLTAVDQIVISDRQIAVTASRHYRTLRALGITIRKTIDTLIATRCITDGIPLLFSDKDFEPFVAHLGLQDAMHI
jgi:predicted nucleic acid-binding protein